MVFREITVTVNKIKTERAGQLIIFVFDEPGFPKQHEKALLKFNIPVDGSEARVPVKVPENMNFALKVLHDENMDGKVTKNWTGFIPYDGIGFTNGARIRFGVPDFEDAAISYHADMAPSIAMQYF